MLSSCNKFGSNYKNTCIRNCRDVCNDDIYNNDIYRAICKDASKEIYRTLRSNVATYITIFWF